jgi:hypothetical protein
MLFFQQNHKKLGKNDKIKNGSHFSSVNTQIDISFSAFALTGRIDYVILQSVNM